MSETSEIPVIDLGPLGLSPATCFWKPADADPDVIADLAAQIHKAFTTVGFLYLSNHGVPEEQVEKANDIGRAFFDLPDNTKSRYCSRSDTEGFYGWSGRVESLNVARPPDFKEAYNSTPSGSKFWPNEHVPGFQDTTMTLLETNHRLGQVVLYLMAVGLGLEDKEYFCRVHDPLYKASRTTIRYAQYPPIPDDIELAPDTIRCGEHSDWTSVTFLYQDDCGGLEAMNRAKKYVPVTPIEGTIVVNVGDVMQRWTADKLISTKHRVVLPEVTSRARHTRRTSLAFFYHPDDDHLITCVDGSNKYDPVTAYDYVTAKFHQAYIY